MITLRLICCLLAVFVGGHLVGLDRHAGHHHRLKKGPKFTMERATFFGGPGAEEFVAVTMAPSGQIVAVGNSWGPPFPAKDAVEVLGVDQLWDVPTFPYGSERARRPPGDHPNRTGFLVFYDHGLSEVERVLRFGWGTASISAAVPLRNGGMVIVGNATQRFAGLIPEGVPVRRHEAPEPSKRGDVGPIDYEGVLLPGDVYVARLSEDLATIEWAWILEGHRRAPNKIFEGRDGETVFNCRGIKRVSADGEALDSFDGTALGRVGGRFRGVYPEDGSILAGGYYMTGTGREPWKMPFLQVYEPDGSPRTGYYYWYGPLVGHDDYRLVSDSNVVGAGFGAGGDIFIFGWSDGGNNVFHHHPMDLDRGIDSKGLGMSLWAATVGSFPSLVRFDPRNPEDAGYTLWTAYNQIKPMALKVDDAIGLHDGALAVRGGTGSYLVQTTTDWFRAPDQYKHDSQPYKMGPRSRQENGWPIWQGIGGRGPYVAVLSPDLTELWWSSSAAQCRHTALAAHPKGVVAVSYCERDGNYDGRDPLVTARDFADWPGLVKRLNAKGPKDAPSPERQLWLHLPENLRDELALVESGEISERTRVRFRRAVIDLQLEAEDFYDSAAWPDAEFDPYETRLLAEIRDRRIAPHELAYFNRGLLERAFPEHVWARPKHNMTPVVNAIQPEFGGGPSDGHIYFLQRPEELEDWKPKPGRMRRVGVANEEERKAKEAKALKERIAVAKSVKVERDELDDYVAELAFPFDKKQFKKKEFPGYCTTYAVFRNPEKERPLFIFGWPDSGRLEARIDNDMGLAEVYTIDLSGEATIRLDGFNTWGANGADGYTCGAWLPEDEDSPPVKVTIDAVHDWKSVDRIMKLFINPKRGLLDEDQRAAFKPHYTALIDFTLSHGDTEMKLTDVPCRVRFRDLYDDWSMRFDWQTTFDGADIGLEGADAGEIEMRFTHEAWCDLPKAHKPGADEPELDLGDL